MKYRVTLNNKIYEVEVEKGEAVLLDEYEAKAPQAKVATVTAPIAVAAPAAEAAPVASGEGTPFVAPLPGVIVQVKVTVGQTVKAGDVLFIAESMKMENEVSSDRAGVVTSVLVAKGASIAIGTPLAMIK